MLKESRGGPRNSSRGRGSGPEYFKFRVQVRGNFHILTSKKKTKKPLGGVLNPLPPGSATGGALFCRYIGVP